MKPVGTHLLLDLFDPYDETWLTDGEMTTGALRMAAATGNSTYISHDIREFEGGGFTSMILLAESHISIHTWPERNFAAIDIFMCGDYCDPFLAMQYIMKTMECKNAEYTSFTRGTRHCLKNS